MVVGIFCWYSVNGIKQNNLASDLLTEQSWVVMFCLETAGSVITGFLLFPVFWFRHVFACTTLQEKIKWSRVHLTLSCKKLQQLSRVWGLAQTFSIKVSVKASQDTRSDLDTCGSYMRCTLVSAMSSVLLFLGILCVVLSRSLCVLLRLLNMSRKKNSQHPAKMPFAPIVLFVGVRCQSPASISLWLWQTCDVNPVRQVNPLGRGKRKLFSRFPFRLTPDSDTERLVVPVCVCVWCG